MSELVGFILLRGVRAAGYEEFTSVKTNYDIARDEIAVRLDNSDGKRSVNFRIPNHLFDPLEYAREKWPDWFVRTTPENKSALVVEERKT
jgi:hypothetical protein